LAKMLIDLGNRSERQGKHQEAQTHYTAAMDLLRNLASELAATPGYQNDLADSRDRMGTLMLLRGKKLDAHGEHRADLETREKLARDFPDASIYRSGIAESRD